MSIIFRADATNMPKSGDTIEVKKIGTSTSAAMTDRYGNAITQPYTIAPDAEGFWGVDTVNYERVDVYWNGAVWFKGAIIADPVPVAGEMKTIKAPPLPTQAVIDKAVSQGFEKENIEVVYASNTEPSDADFIDQMIALGLSRENLFWRDTSAFNPVVDSVTIASGDYATSTSITLDLTCADQGEMMIAEDAGFTTRTDGLAVAWEPFAASKIWTIPATEGATTTIYVKYRNADLVETAAVSDSVILDTVAPTISMPAGSTDYPDTRLTVSATDATSGVLDIYMTNDGTTPTYPPTGTTFRYDGSYINLQNNVAKTISVLAVDNAGKVSAVRTETYTSKWPEVATFEVGTASGMSIPITGFTALDTGVVIDGFLITESSTKPTSDPPAPSVSTMADWSATPPSSYAATKTGPVSIWPWVKAGTEVSPLDNNLGKSFNAQDGNTAPTAPTIAASGTPTTSAADVSLSTASSDTEDGTISTYEIYADGVKNGTDRTWSVGGIQSLTGLTPGATISVTAKGKDSAGLLSAASTAVSITLLCAAPTGHSVDAGDTQITLHPGASNGATSFNAYYTTNGTTPSKTNGTKLTAVTDGQTVTGLTNGTQVNVVYTAVNATGESAESTMVSATPQAVAPAAPTGGGLTAGDGLVTMDPGTSSGATSYNAYYTLDGTTPTMASTKIAGVTAGQTLTVANGTTVTMGYTAVNANGESALSTIYTATPAAAGLTLLDDFNRTDGTLLEGDANYVETVDNTAAWNLVIQGGRLTTTGAGQTTIDAAWSAPFVKAGSAAEFECSLRESPNPSNSNGILLRAVDNSLIGSTPNGNRGWFVGIYDNFDASGNITSHRFIVRYFEDNTTTELLLDDSTSYTTSTAVRMEISGDTMTLKRKETSAGTWSTIGTFNKPAAMTALGANINFAIKPFNLAFLDNFRGGNT